MTFENLQSSQNAAYYIFVPTMTINLTFPATIMSTAAQEHLAPQALTNVWWQNIENIIGCSETKFDQ
jgi:hypothetical protein